MNRPRRRSIPPWAQMFVMVGPGIAFLSWVGASINSSYQYKESLASKSEVAEVAKSIRDLIQQNKLETASMIQKTSEDDRLFTRTYSDDNRNKTLAEMNEKIGKLSLDMTEKMSKVANDVSSQSAKVDLMLRTLTTMRDEAWTDARANSTKKRGHE